MSVEQGRGDTVSVAKAGDDVDDAGYPFVLPGVVTIERARMAPPPAGGPPSRGWPLPEQTIGGIIAAHQGEDQLAAGWVSQHQPAFVGPGRFDDAPQRTMQCADDIGVAGFELTAAGERNRSRGASPLVLGPAVGVIELNAPTRFTDGRRRRCRAWRPCMSPAGPGQSHAQILPMRFASSSQAESPYPRSSLRSSSRSHL